MKLVPATPEKIAERMLKRSGIVETSEHPARIAAVKRETARRDAVRESLALHAAATAKLAVCTERDERRAAGINLRLERIISKSGGGRATWAFDARAAKAAR